ncbi:hypothetical protein TNCV_1955551 [Trichonephila clavipes]|nr:hypothetical protein TNCV_1955551 [Trichonephila clavipes]
MQPEPKIAVPPCLLQEGRLSLKSKPFVQRSFFQPWEIFLEKNDNKRQPIGVTVHSTQQPIREQLLSSKPRQKLLKIYHPDEAQKPRLPDPIVQPITVMPLSRT